MPARRAVSSTVSWRCSRARASGDCSPTGSSGSTSSMLVGILLLAVATFRYLIGKIDVSWSVQVVTGDELGRQGADTGIRPRVPGVPGQEQGVEAPPAVGRRDPLRRVR